MIEDRDCVDCKVYWDESKRAGNICYKCIIESKDGTKPKFERIKDD